MNLDWFKSIVISTELLVVAGVLIFLLLVNIFLFYVTKKKQQQKLLDSKEHKKLLEKLNVKEIKVKADKSVKADKGEKINSYNPMKSMSKRTFGYWKAWYLDKYHPGTIVLINMELTNGFHRSFTVKEKEEGFIFRGKKYLFDDDHKYYNIDAKLYAFDYHEGLTLPIKRKIPVTEIKKTMESTEEIDIEYAINPSTLQRFMTAKIAEGVMKGSQLDEFMRKLQMFLIVTMIAVLVHLALFLYGSGMLQNIKVPGLIG